MSEPTNDEETNEILAAAKDAKEREEKALAEADKGRGTWPIAAIGIGIGSAAVAAAMLYASNRGRSKRNS